MKKRAAQKKDVLDQPATKRDLQKFATKDDLKKELQKYATKDDIVDLTESYARLETKIEELERYMLILIENAVGDIVAAIKDKQSLTDDKLKDHEQRILVLEKHS